MRVIAFPGRRMSAAEEAALAQLEAALDGDGTGPEAEYWRELRADVRSLAEPIDPAFAQSLKQRVGRLSQPKRGRRPARPRRLAISARGRIALAIAATLGAVLVAVIVTGALTETHTSRPVANAAGPERFGGPSPDALGTANGPGLSGAGAHGPSVGKASGAAASPTVVKRADLSPSVGAEAPGEAGGRLQHLGASISLSATGSEGVQQIADRVGRATVAAGGFVESSRVQTQQGSAGEALLTLVLPSAKLASTLAQLERIAPVRAQTQALQDITSEYDAVGARLAAARGERAALLRALANASTPAALESLHARIAQANGKIAAAERQQASISREASQAQVEVSVLGQAHHAGGGLTLGHGLSDAGHVLTVVLAVLIVAAAVLVPLALALAALLLGGRFWRRQRRERVLGSS